jgi:hypothetical protein
VVAAYPYIPGSNTDAFKGVSIFVGLLVSLGSTSVVGQAASGLILMYSRALKGGDYVRVGETEGTVVSLGMLSTKIRTPKNEEISIPSGVMIGTVIKNYTRLVKEEGVIVYTSVTIGYDTPWRQVHAMLIQAADRTEGLRKDAKPFVFQTALSDFYVEYQLNAYIKKPGDRVPCSRHFMPIFRTPSTSSAYRSCHRITLVIRRRQRWSRRMHGISRRPDRWRTIIPDEVNRNAAGSRERRTQMRSYSGRWMTAILLAVLVSGFPFGGPMAEAARAVREGGEAVEGPRGGEAVEGPRGGEAVEGPRGGEAVRGPAGNVAVGTRVTTLPNNAATVVVGGKTYYVADDVYYQPYYSGAEVTYVVVSPPQQ